jgi:putative ABC transport system permease protein
MFKNYFKIAFRNLIRHKTFSLISILGLAFGIAICSVIFLYVSFENSYDTFNINADNIYRMENVRYYKSGTDSSTGCIASLGPTLKEEIPEVVDFARLRKISMLVSANNHFFNEKNIFWADHSFLKMFSYPLLSGIAEKALTERFSAVITKSLAQKYFGNRNAMGETIQIGGTDFRITGIAEDVPSNSHIKFDILISFVTQLTNSFCWGCNNNTTYIQVRPGTKQPVIEAKLPLILNKLHNRQKDGFNRTYLLQPLKSIHLNSDLRFEFEKNGNAETIYFLSIIAAVILLIAWINYINLSTARSIERAKEVGLRKVVGAEFSTLISRFLLESFIVNFIAVVFSILIVLVTFPFCKTIIGLPDSFSMWSNTNLIILLLALIFISPLIAGLYPAFILSSYSPVSILKGSFKNSMKGILLRKGLVIFQFTISIILIAVIIVFNQQISFMREKDLGFDIKQKLVLNSPAYIQEGHDRISSYNTFINELKNKSLIEDATFTSVIPGMENSWVSGGVIHDKQPVEQGKQMYFAYVAQNYINFFDIKLVCGQNFFEDEIARSNNNGLSKSILINESAVKDFGFTSPKEAIGAVIHHDNFKVGKVVGVIKDYHQQSLDKEIEPTIFVRANRGDFFVFDVNTKNVHGKIQGIEKDFNQMFPGNPVEYNFLDDFFDQQYKSQIQTEEILSVFMVLSIFISCLGLVGLSSLMTTQKTKEIGVRKVLGASIQSILALLTKEFIKWVFIADIIAAPISYYFMNKWLQDFAYRIDISWWVFVLSSGIALAIAVATVSLQAIKAALANPIESLRYE